MAVPWPVGDPVTDNIQQNFIDPFNAAQTQYVIELHPAGSLLAMPIVLRPSAPAAWK